MLCALPPFAVAQDLEPRAYSNAPVGMNFLIAGYAWTSGDVLTDPALPVEDAHVSANSALLAYSRVFDFFGKCAKADVLLPWTSADGQASVDGQPYGRKVSGLSDPRLRVSVNLVGAPAMTLEEFRDYHQRTILGVSFAVFPPLGQYDSDKLLNLGTNRWVFRPEIGMSQALGKFIFELAPALSLYTDNDDWFGGHRREQKPLLSLQGHLLYTFPFGIWAAFDSSFYLGGRAVIDGVSAKDKLENVRVGGTVTLPLGRHFSLKLYGSAGAYAKAGSDFTVVGTALQYRWGGGL